jgi:hypothetical protein
MEYKSLTNFYISPWSIVCLMVLNSTFNNISVISWQSVLLVEETGIVCQWLVLHITLCDKVCQWLVLHITLCDKVCQWLVLHITLCDKVCQWLVLHSCIGYTSPWAGFELTTLVMMGISCIGSCKSNYNTITSTTAPVFLSILFYCFNYLLHW